MAGPPPPPLFQNQGNRPAAPYRPAVAGYRGAEGAPRGHGFGGGRGYSPPSSVPVSGRGYASPSFAAGGRLPEHGQPSFTNDGRLRDCGFPSFAPDSRLQNYGQDYFAAERLAGPRRQLSFAAVGGPRLAAVQRQLSFAEPRGPTSIAAEGERFLAAPGGATSFAPTGPRGQPPFAPQFSSSFAAGGERFAAPPSFAAPPGQPPFAAEFPSSFAVGGERFAAPPSFAAPPGQPPFAVEFPSSFAAGGERFAAPPSFAAPPGQPSFAFDHGAGVPDQRFAAAGARPFFRAPLVAAGQGLPVLSAYSHGVAMEADGRASHASGPVRKFNLCDQPVVTITRKNYHSTFNTIKQILAERSGRLYIALDLEYVASSTTDLSSQPRCSTQWYENLRDFVNGGEIVQLGIVFARDGPSPVTLHAYELNFHIDATCGKYNQKSLDFLVANNHILEEYMDFGLFQEWAYADLIRHLPFGDPSVTWVTFHADRDLAFLMKLAVEGGRGMQPESRVQFLHQARQFFPVMYDVRVLAQLITPRYRGSLKKLAEELCIKRRGQEHFAGSDALVTLECFARIVERFGEQAISSRLGLLSGAEELEMAITCALPLSYTATSLSEVLVPGEQSLGDSISVEDGYQRLLKLLNQVDKFHVELCFMNRESMISYGRIWEFTMEDDQLAHGLARLLASSGATHNPDRIWVTLHGARGIACLLRSFTAPAPMPVRYPDYLSSRSCCFPSLCDIASVANTCSDVPVLPTTGCKGDLAHMCRSLGVASHSSQVVTMLRCYTRFRDRGDLRTLRPGLLLEQCSKCKQ